MSGALLYVYVNESTTDLASIYTDEALSVPSANPAVANTSGQFPSVWAGAGTEADPVLYRVAVTTSDGGSPGNAFVFDNYRPSVDFDTATAALAEAAAASSEASADEAAQSLADIEIAIQAAQDADGVAAVAGAIAGQAAAEVVVALKADTDFANVDPTTGRDALNAQRREFVSAPSILRGVDNKLTQDFHFFDIVTSESDQAAIRTGTSVTDWSDAMDEAMARLLVANQDDPGKAMTMPDGQIYLSRALNKPYGAALIGRGREFTRIINTSATGHGIVVPEFDRGSIIRGVSIERNVVSDAGTYGIYLSHGTSGMLLDRVGVRRFQNGIFGGSTDYGTIIQPEIDDCYNDGWVQQDTKASGDPNTPTSYDPAVQWQLEKPLVRWCQGVAYKATANPSGRGHIAGEWRNPGTFENGQTLLISGSSPTLSVNDVRVNDGFVGSDNLGPDVETYGKNNEFSFDAVERMGMDSYGPRFNPDGTSRTRSTPGGAGYGRGFRAGINNGTIRLRATIDDTAGYGVIAACDMNLDLSVRNPGIATDASVGVIQFAGSLTGQITADAATSAVQFTTDEAHALVVSGAPVAGVATPTSSILSPGGFRDALKVAGVALIDGQSTGFVAMTGTARKTAFATYGGGTAGAAYTQAQIQGIMDALVAVSERLKAHDDALLAKKVPSV